MLPPRAQASDFNLTVTLPDSPPTVSSANDYGTVAEMINNGSPNHTGWSGTLYEYSETSIIGADGKMTNWIPTRDTAASTDSHPESSFPVTMFKDQIVAEYGQHIYDALKASGKEFKPIYGDKYLEYDRRESMYDSTKDFNPPKPGDKAFIYFDNKVEVDIKLSMAELMTLLQGQKPEPDPTFNLTRTSFTYCSATYGNGYVAWGLFKESTSPTGGSATLLRAENELPIGSGHCAQTPASWKMSGVINTTSKNYTKPATKADKGTENYSVNYSYTDTNRHDEICTRPAEIWEVRTGSRQAGVDEDGDPIYEDFEYDFFVGYNYKACYSESYWSTTFNGPDWGAGALYSCSINLAFDHNFGETFIYENGIGGEDAEWKIGHKVTYTNGCNPQTGVDYKEQLQHDSQHASLTTQTYTPFMKNPLVWSGSPLYGIPSVFPYVAEDQQGTVGVPELDPVFKQNNKYTTQHPEFLNPYAIPLTQEVNAFAMNMYSADDFWVSRSTGFQYSTPRGMGAEGSTSEFASKYQAFTGEDYRDVIQDRAELVSMYYLPIDANDNVMTPNTTYKMETQVKNLGISNLTINHTQTYDFKYYLLGSVFEEKDGNDSVWIVEQNEIPYTTISYPYSVTITPAQAKTIHEATKDRTNFIFGHKYTESMGVYDMIQGVIGGPSLSQKLPTAIPHIHERETENARLSAAN